MKKIHVITNTLFISFFVSIASNAQKKLNLTLKYDNEFNRYEVYVKPNFTQRNFTWGPSQISIVLPSNVLVDKININNVDGGTWEDNSVIHAPEVTPDYSYHGIITTGNKTDLTENHESVLFYFSLPKNIDPKKIRVFDNGSDPKSISKGMMGGDFKNSIVDMTGRDWFSEVYGNAKMEIVEIREEKVDFEAILFPNVVTERKFKLSFNNFKEEDGDILMVLSNDLGKELLRRRGSKSFLEKEMVNLPESANSLGLIVKFITSKGSISKRLVTEN